MPGRSLWRKRDNVAKLPSGTSAGRPAVLAGSLCLRTLFHWPLISPSAVAADMFSTDGWS